MLTPLNWLKEYVEIRLPLKELMWKMTEAGLTCESTLKAGDETILDVEVTANRPDWMSIVGIAREVAAIQGIKIKEPKIKELPVQNGNFPIDLVPDFNLFERWSAVILKDIKIAPSPKWLAERIKFMGHTPINNVIDITNYVMYELGIPMHAFDYDEIYGQIMTVTQSKGGEDFTTVDGLTYKLPKDAMIIKDAERIIDLAGIKGGANSGIKESTKNIFLHVTIDNPVLTRRASIAMGLRSDASAIYERGPDKGSTINSLKKAANLILESAGGAVASKIIDIQKEKYSPTSIFMSFAKLEKILGIKVPDADAVQILKKLNLSPKKSKLGITCSVPTYRGDIKIEEDLVEEVARLYGYNKFPLTMPVGQTNDKKIPYYFDDSLIIKIKNLLVSSGYSETKNLSLISKDLIAKFGMNPVKHFKITNPVSSEYEYMRTSLIPSLVSAVKINSIDNLMLFEVDKVYLKTGKDSAEKYKIAVIFTGDNFRNFKTVIELILSKLNIENFSIEFESDKPYFHQSKSGTLKTGETIIGEFGEINPFVLNALEISGKIYCFEMDVETLEKLSKFKTFSPVPVNPAQVEDITLSFPAKTRIGEVIKAIKNLQLTINNVEFRDTYKDSYTFRIWYQDANKTLTNEEVEKIRLRILSLLKTKFGGTIKE
jgi:phenylalanyl-tRNA synthetase beta chain